MKTKIQKDAVAKANEMVPILKASTTEIISAHVKYAKGLTAKQKTLRIFDAWNVYIERVWRTLKYENIYLYDYGTVNKLRKGIDRFFNFYNAERFHQSLNYKVPNDIYFQCASSFELIGVVKGYQPPVVSTSF